MLGKAVYGGRIPSDVVTPGEDNERGFEIALLVGHPLKGPLSREKLILLKEIFVFLD